MFSAHVSKSSFKKRQLGPAKYSYVHPGFDNYGSTEQIALSFTGVSSLIIAGEWDGSFIMDDFGFDSTAPVPEPATMLLFGTGLAGLLGSGIRKKIKKLVP
jgi:hypothetical protein